MLLSDYMLLAYQVQLVVGVTFAVKWCIPVCLLVSGGLEIQTALNKFSFGEVS